MRRLILWLATTATTMTALRAPAPPRVARPRPPAAAPLPVAEAPTVPAMLQPMHALTAAERDTLDREGAVERRSRLGRVGRALVVVDSAMAPDAAWAAVRDVAAWPRRMRGVKRARVAAGRGGALRAALAVTKLRLPANLVFTEEDAGENAHVLRFSLDRDRANVALEAVDGAWRVAPRAGGGCRVSLEAEVGACAIVPASLVDAVAEKALRRATAWLR